jgi:rhamnosyltransferase subunit B
MSFWPPSSIARRVAPAQRPNDLNTRRPLAEPRGPALSRKREILIVTVGSFGDLLPFLTIGKALSSRGYSVTIGTNSEYELHVRRRGFDFAPIFVSEGSDGTVDDPRFWDAERAWPFVWERILEPALRPTYELVVATARRTSCLVIGSWMAFGARLAQERHGIPLISAYLAPQPLNAGSATRERSALTEGVLQDAVLGPALNAYRAELGLPPIDDICGHWMHSPRGGLALFPEWFCAPQPCWPRQVLTTGFPVFDGAMMAVPHQRLKDFQAAGPPPLLFTPGTGMRQAAGFFRQSLEACASLGLRAILLTPHRDQVPVSLPPWALHLDYVPMHLALSRAALVVYHGGIGTCAQTIRSGSAHVVVPMAFDQFDNARRVEGLGLGFSLPMNQYCKQSAARLLARVLESTEIKQRSTEFAQKFSNDNPVETICDLIDRWV